MNVKPYLILLLAIFGNASCSLHQYDATPFDAEEISYHSLSIGFSLPQSAPGIAGGFVSGIVYTPGLLVGNSSIWSDGSDANMAIGVTSADLESMKLALTYEFSDVQPVYTYSERHAGAERDARLGIYYRDYYALAEIGSHVSISFTGIKGDYYRTMAFFVPLEHVNAEFWEQLKRALPENDQFTEFVAGLTIFWINNA